jgi:hypothetical protein
MILNYDKKTTGHTRDSASRAQFCTDAILNCFPDFHTVALPPQPSWQPSTSKEALDALDLEEQLERDLVLELDAEGEPDYDLQFTLLQREEEEEDEEEAIPRALSPPPQPKPQRPAKSNAAIVKSKAIPARGKGKREYGDTSDGEEENLEFGQPAQPAKRSRPSPPSEGLALPGSFSAPSPLVDPQVLPASDSEEDWDEVAATEPAPTPLQDDVYIEEGGGGDVEEIDMTAFEAEMNETLEEDEEDFLAAAVESEANPLPAGRHAPFGQLTGGEPSQDEDDFSSSDESDDE